jgi:hypothetical protein
MGIWVAKLRNGLAKKSIKIKKGFKEAPRKDETAIDC